MAFRIDFEPVGRRGECEENESLLDCARQLGVGIVSVCGGRGKCQACKVQVLKGTVSEPGSNELGTFSAQEMGEGWRLACQAYPTSDCKVSVPPESMAAPQRTQVEGLQISVVPEPSVRDYLVEMPEPTLEDSHGDGDSLLQTLNTRHKLQCNRVDVEVLRSLSPKLRSWGWQARASVRDNELVALGARQSQQLGLAVDLGSTKIAGYLVDLSNGQTLSAKGIMNPQISYGEDIISRLTRVLESPQEGAHLQKLAVDALSDLAQEMCAEVGADTERIIDSVVVGNTAMHHLFIGLPVRQLALSPFVPAVGMSLDIKSRDLGLRLAPGAYVHLLPNIAGYVGGDHVAMLLATEAWQADRLTVALDIGTNTEVSIIDDGRMTAVSCASGPAFEGGQIRDGMRAASGAIERLQIEQDSIQYHTIDDVPPVGICGSGVLDAMAQLYLAGVVNERGRMKDSDPRVRTRDGQREFVIASDEGQKGHPEIVMTQGDVRQLQLAKAAIRTGIQILLESQGRSEEEIGQVIIAGAFGTYIDLSSAVTIGMLPSLPLDRFRQVGNAAGTGARLAVVSLGKRIQAQSLASRVDYMELGSASGFTETFIQAGYIGQYRIRQARREAIG
ncbi:ASKHA domain-containing protein [Chloroflexota bacterium]